MAAVKTLSILPSIGDFHVSASTCLASFPGSEEQTRGSYKYSGVTMPAKRYNLLWMMSFVLAGLLLRFTLWIPVVLE